MIFAISFTGFLIINLIYIKLWKKNSRKTPTGIGIFLLIPFAFFCFNQNINLYGSISLFLCSIFYYLDDLIKINFKIRILLQILASVIIFNLYKDLININYLIIIIFLFFLISNSFNFQDGEDLNIFVLLFLIFSLFYFYSNQQIIRDVSLLILSYLICFGFFNRKPNTLFFGDSGCYIVTIILSIFLINELDNLNLIKSVSAILIFPITDIGLVIIYRILKKEDLLSRNYHHIYQKLHSKINGLIYLLPNFFFAIVNFLLFKYFYLSIFSVIYILLFNLFSCVVIQFSIYKLLPNANK